MANLWLISILLILTAGCKNSNENRKQKVAADENAIRLIQQNYLDAWRAGDENKVLSLFEADSRIQPSALCPIEGLKNIQQFWFPKNGSLTKINQFNIKLLYVDVDGDTAVSSGESFLNWS